MSKTTKVAALVIAAATIGTGSIWLASDALSPIADHTPVSEVADVADEPGTVDPEVARLQQRVVELERRLSVRQRRAERHEERPVETPHVEETAPPKTSPAVDEIDAAVWGALRNSLKTATGKRDLVALNAAASPPKLAQPVDITQLTDDELLAHAKELSNTSKAESRVAWRALVAREPATEILDKALFGLGIAERRASDHDAELAAFQRLADHAGPDSDRGQEARYQRAWALYYAGDYANGLREMDALADATDGRTDRARHALLNGSSFAEKLNDPERARSMLIRLQRAVKNDKSSLARWFDRTAGEKLKALK